MPAAKRVPAVNGIDDIRRSLETFDGYLFSRNEEVRIWARDMLPPGHNFVAGDMEGRVTFGPSRFIGYANNYLERHRGDLPDDHPEAFGRNQPNGGETDPAIDLVLDRIRRGQPDWRRFEKLDKGLCEERGCKPHNRERTYWNLDCDLDCDAGFVDLDGPYAEGRRVSTAVRRSERSAAARAACIRKYGLSCVVCNFDFEKRYGEHGKGFIHVHHLNPLAHGEREVDPKKDLRPVCPNCHYMLHRNGLLTPDELRGMIRA